MNKKLAIPTKLSLQSLGSIDKMRDKVLEKKIRKQHKSLKFDTGLKYYSKESLLVDED